MPRTTLQPDPGPLSDPVPEGLPPTTIADTGVAVETVARTVFGTTVLLGRPDLATWVAAVAVNRTRRDRPGTVPGDPDWADALAATCADASVFVCWRPQSVVRPALLAVRAGDPAFETCLRVARRAVVGVLPDPTGGAVDPPGPPEARALG